MNLGLLSRMGMGCAGRMESRSWSGVWEGEEAGKRCIGRVGPASWCPEILPGREACTHPCLPVDSVPLLSFFFPSGLGLGAACERETSCSEMPGLL